MQSSGLAIRTKHRNNIIKKKSGNNYRKRKLLYLMAVPGILIYIIFRYIPMAGIIIAFENYNPFTGVSAFWTSKFVGFHWFIFLFSQPTFFQLLRNTLLLGIYGTIFAFPVPIILAIIFNEVNKGSLRKLAQSISYLPHFLSWAIVGSIFLQLLSPNGGVINIITGFFGMQPTYFAQDPKYARSIVILSGIWKEVGWSSILYFAAIVSVDTTLYESAIVDGAGKFKQIIYITIPSIMPIITITLILGIGMLLETGFDQVYMFYNAKVDNVLNTFDIYSYRIGIGRGQFSYITALGLFKNIVGMFLILVTNKFAKMIGEQGIW